MGEGWCEMVPLVLLDGKPIDPDLIIKVQTFREFNRPDMAIISMNAPPGDILYNIGQAVQIDLSSRGGTVYTGVLFGIEPDFEKEGKKRLILRCITKTFRIPSTSNPDSEFRDIISRFTYNDSRDYVTQKKVGVLVVEVKKSIETGRVLYELSWAKDIRSDQFRANQGTYLHDGYFVGFITRVDRTYSQSAGPELTIAFLNEPPKFVPQRDFKSAKPRRGT